MIVPSPRILGVHALAGDGDRWLADGLSIRVLMHPRLGIPQGPLAVSIQGFREYPDSHTVTVEGTGRGWRGNGEVDGTAWLRLIPIPPETRVPINVRLFGDFEPGTRVSVVRRPVDPGEGIIAASNEPYMLWAPRVTFLRVDGRCRIKDAVVSYPDVEFAAGDARRMGLPFGPLGSHFQFRYAGVDPTGDEAMERVRRGAPPMPGPHELDANFGGDPPGAEEARVKGLVFDGGTDVPLADDLLTVLNLPHLQRADAFPISDLIANSPKPTSGTRQRLEGILAAAGDPGIARWLGLAGTFDFPPDGPVLSVTVTGRWILPNSPWAGWLQQHQDVATAQQLLTQAGLGDVLTGNFGTAASVYLCAQARVDLSIKPDDPRSPDLRGNPEGVWIEKDGRDVVRLPIAFGGVGPLARGALVRTDGGAVETVLPASPGEPSRVRTLLVRDGNGVDLVMDPPRDDGQYRFAGWQADMFGRWSERSADATVTSPNRPGLPAPEPQWFHDLAQPGPVGEAGYPQQIEVHVPVPRRRAGEPAISDVRIELGGSVETPPAQRPSVESVLSGPALGRAQSASSSLVVAFIGDDGSTRSAPAIAIDFVDPRAPIPPPRDPVLHFAAPPDRTGLSGYAVPLSTGQGIEGWRLFATTEARLIAAAAADGLVVPNATLSRDERANQWLGQQANLKPSRFDCLTPAPVSSGVFHGTLPGTAADILFVRPVPQRHGVEPPFRTCPMIAIAAPSAAAPSMPELALDRSVTPSVLRITTHLGSVGANRYRLRMATSSSADPRTAVVVDEAAFDGTAVAVQVPRLRPFARVWVTAEVRSVAEAGIAPIPTRWSAATPPVELHRVPSAGPQIADPPTVAAAAGGLTVTVPVPGIAQSPVPGPYEIRLYEQAGPTEATRWIATAPVSGETGVLSFAPTAGSTYQVVLVDPLGRTSPPSAIAVP